MHQDHSSILSIIHHILDCGIYILGFPVKGIYRPEDHRAAYNRRYSIVDCTIRRSYHCGGVSCQILYFLICCRKLTGNILCGQSSQICMVIGVVSDFTSQGFHSGYWFRKTLDFFSHKEKGCLCIIGLQTVQKPVCKITGSIVKGKCDHFAGGWFYSRYCRRSRNCFRRRSGCSRISCSHSGRRGYRSIGIWIHIKDIRCRIIILDVHRISLQGTILCEMIDLSVKSYISCLDNSVSIKIILLFIKL